MIGRFTERILIEAGEAIREAGGGETVTWSPFATVWAALQITQPRERAAYDDLIAERQVAFTIRHRIDLPERMRIVWGGRPMRVHWVDDVDPARAQLVLHCTEERA